MLEVIKRFENSIVCYLILQFLDRISKANELRSEKEERIRIVKLNKIKEYVFHIVAFLKFRYENFCKRRQEQDASTSCADRKGYGNFFSFPTFSNAPISDVPNGYKSFFEAYNDFWICFVLL